MKRFMLIFVNLLTTIRVIGTICLLPIYLNYGGMVTGLLALGCYLTDLIDGILARKFKVATFFGSIFDGIADKLFSVANLLVLFTITRYALFPIFCEIIIVLIQSYKFSKNINVQSSFTGKAKTLVMGLTVILLYFIIDIKSLTFLPEGIINSIHAFNQSNLFILVFLPLFIFEIATIISYLTFVKTFDKNEKVKIPKIDLKLKEVKSFKDAYDNFKMLWLNNEFYTKYKDSAGLREIRLYVKENR